MLYAVASAKNIFLFFLGASGITRSPTSALHDSEEKISKHIRISRYTVLRYIATLINPRTRHSDLNLTMAMLSCLQNPGWIVQHSNTGKAYRCRNQLCGLTAHSRQVDVFFAVKKEDEYIVGDNSRDSEQQCNEGDTSKKVKKVIGIVHDYDRYPDGVEIMKVLESVYDNSRGEQADH